MTQPEPTPAEPVTEPVQQPAEPAAGPTPFDPSTLSPEAKAYLKTQVDNANYKARTDAKANAAAEERQRLTSEFAKLLGIQSGDEPPDPQQLTAHLEQAQSAAWRSGVELAVFRTAGRLGGDPDKLLDSLAFIDSLDDLTEADPASQDFRSALETKIREAVERNPAYRAGSPAPTAPRPDPSQGPRAPGAPQRPRDLSEAVKTAWAASQAPGR